MIGACADVALAVAELEKRGAAFASSPHRIARMDDARRR
jgi:hypothetical protein